MFIRHGNGINFTSPVMQRLRSGVALSSFENPDDRHKDSHSTQDQTRVVHVAGLDRKLIREAEYNDENCDVQARHAMDRVAKNSLHPERTWQDIGSSRKDMGQNNCKVGACSQKHEGSYEGVESCRGTDVYAT